MPDPTAEALIIMAEQTVHEPIQATLEAEDLICCYAIVRKAEGGDGS